MKKTFSFLLALIVSVSACLVGCASSHHEEAAKAVLTRVYTYPNKALVEFEDKLTEADYEPGSDGAVAFLKEEKVEEQNQIFREILGSEVDDSCAEELYSYFFMEMQLSQETGYTLVPQNIVLEGKDGQYQYTVTALYSDDEVKDSEETIRGRIQFNDQDKIDFISTDKVSYLE